MPLVALKTVGVLRVGGLVWGVVFGPLTVLIADPVDSLLLRLLSERGFKVEYRPNVSREELIEEASRFDVLVVRSRTRVDLELLKAATRLKLVARAGVGLDNIDLEAARRLGVKVIYSAGASQSVAELTIGLLIAAFRMIPLYDRLVKLGKWPKGMYSGRELAGKTLGVIGLGRVGSRVAKLARALGMRVLAYDRRDIAFEAREAGAEPSGFSSLLSESHAVTLHVPLTKETYRMIGWRELESMRDGAVLINTSRGAIVDGRALLSALNSGKLAAAAIDVLEHEPPRESWEKELIAHPHVIATPHIGAETAEAKRRIAAELAEAIAHELGDRGG